MNRFSRFFAQFTAALMIVALALAALPGGSVTQAAPAFVPVVPSGLNGNGPGGVGTVDGTSTLELWLQANQGVFTDTTCTTLAANGNAVACWRDQSGNGRSYTQATAGNRPIYRTNIQNGQPVVDFDGANDRLTSGAVLAGGDDTFTYIASWRPVNAHTGVIFEQNNNTAATGRRAAFLARSVSRYGFNGEGNDFDVQVGTPTYAANAFNVSSIVLPGGVANNVLVFDEGTQGTGTINLTTQNVGTAGGSAVGYKITTADEFFNGDIPEIIVYTDALNSVNRILVENYLSSKYNVNLAANDVYAGDTAGNGNFDLNVAGIGQLGGAQHTASHAAGIIVANSTFLNANGDWLLFGHNTVTNATTIVDLPAAGFWDSRWSRSWYVDVADVGTAGGTVNIIFDYSDSGLGGTPTYPVGAYSLLSRAGTSGAFSDITATSGATVAIFGDQVQFLGVNVSLLDGQKLTLGIEDVTPPTVTSIVVADTLLTVGETSLVTFTFSEAVTGFTNADLTIENGTLSAVSSADGGVTWTATLTPTAGITDATNVITLNNTGVTDLAGNPGVGTTDSNNYAIDTIALTVTAEQAATQTDPTNVGPILFTVTFNKPINASTFTAADVVLSASTTPGLLSASIAELAPNNGTTFEVSVSGMSGSGDVIASIAANSVQDPAGNNNAASTSTDNTVTFDNINPIVASSDLLPEYIGSGPQVFTITFNKPVSDPVGNMAPDDVTNTANYLLVNKGPNGAADTTSCANPLQGDDNQVILSSVSYDAATYKSLVTLFSTLPAGSYRLFVCGTTSIVDLAGNPLNGGSDYTFEFTVQPPVASAAARSATSLPDTGFPKGQITLLPAQPAAKAYSQSDLWLEIPKLGVKMDIVGVPQVDGEWDVTWLGSSAGWLEGSAFPTWAGNTVLTGHVWDANNNPGVFANLKTLKHGDQIKIHAWGQVYTYEVRESRRVSTSRVSSVMKHEKLDWLTLVTCEDYRFLWNTYSARRMVRAVLVSVK